MGRQILAVAVGIALSFLAAAACADLVYRHSDFWSLRGPAVARYILNPLVALLVGACVGMLAKSRPAGIAAATATFRMRTRRSPSNLART
jgi:hypothetical protein